MRPSQSVKLGAWILVALNLIMSFGSIWIFMRMAPAIEVIIEQNQKSLGACEEMLSQLALAPQSQDSRPALERNLSAFADALNRAADNITENDEAAPIAAIKDHYEQAFTGNAAELARTISAINQLSAINRDAMVVADQKAKQFGNAGAWAIVFMASAVFLVGMLFIRSMKRNLVAPLEEIREVIETVRGGNVMRRCTGPAMPADVKFIYNGINEILDQNSTSLLNGSEQFQSRD